MIAPHQWGILMRRCATFAVVAFAVLAFAVPAADSAGNTSIGDQAFSSFSGVFGDEAVSGQIGGNHEMDIAAGSSVDLMTVGALTFGSSTGSLIYNCLVFEPMLTRTFVINDLTSATLNATLPCTDGYGAPAGSADVFAEWAGSGTDTFTRYIDSGFRYSFTDRAATLTEFSVTVNGISLVMSGNDGYLERSLIVG
jgi:hypothetical protein